MYLKAHGVPIGFQILKTDEKIQKDLQLVVDLGRGASYFCLRPIFCFLIFAGSNAFINKEIF